jgi:hypothetical protein
LPIKESNVNYGDIISKLKICKNSSRKNVVKCVLDNMEKNCDAIKTIFEQVTNKNK